MLLLFKQAFEGGDGRPAGQGGRGGGVEVKHTVQ